MTPTRQDCFSRIGERLGRLVPRRLRHDESGAAAVEFGLVAVPFFILVCGIIEIALIFATGQLMDTAVADAARLIRTGQVQQQKFSQAKFKEQVCSGVSILIECDKLYVDVRTITTFSAAVSKPPLDEEGRLLKNETYEPGKASQIVVVRVFYEFPQIFSGIAMSGNTTASGKRLLGAVTALRNEPFPW